MAQQGRQGRTTAARLACAGLCLWLLMLASTAPAHRAREALTTIVWNARNGTLEIVHSLHQEDALLALELTGGPAREPADALRTRARVALYAARRFTLRDAAGAALEPTLLGARLDGDQYLVFRELPLEVPPPRIGIADALLLEPFADPRNHVNYEIGPAIDSLVLHGSLRTGTLEPVRPTAEVSP